jgi:hypothetical protein
MSVITLMGQAENNGHLPVGARDLMRRYQEAVAGPGGFFAAQVKGDLERIKREQLLGWSALNPPSPRPMKFVGIDDRGRTVRVTVEVLEEAPARGTAR